MTKAASSTHILMARFNGTARSEHELVKCHRCDVVLHWSRGLAHCTIANQFTLLFYLNDGYDGGRTTFRSGFADDADCVAVDPHPGAHHTRCSALLQQPHMSLLHPCRAGDGPRAQLAARGGGSEEGAQVCDPHWYVLQQDPAAPGNRNVIPCTCPDIMFSAERLGS